MSQNTLKFQTASSGPVECLGQTFPSDEARREHYLKLLAAKLKDSEFRKTEGFPIGKDEDILALSDPPYYTACPNPWIGDFIKAYGTDYDPKKPYHREPFAADVSEGKNHPIYNAHSYHTKVPHRAIMRYILHYTQPGDLVFDGFAGTGMTGVAAQFCGDRSEVQQLGYRVQNDGTILNEEGKTFSKIGVRYAVLNDLSPAASFIANNYNTPVDVSAFEQEAQRILRIVDGECGWMYQTRHGKSAEKGRINYTVWSDVFLCNQCAQEVVFWHAAVDAEAGEVRDEFPCPSCNATLTKRSIQRAFVTRFDKAIKTTVKQAKQVPVLVNYSFGRSRYEKAPDKEDLALVEKVEAADIPYPFPTIRMPDGDEARRNDPIGITHAHHFYSKRNLFVLACLRHHISKSPLSSQLLCLVGDQLPRASKMHKIAVSRLNTNLSKTAGVLAGTLYVPSNQIEYSVLEMIGYRIKDVASYLGQRDSRTRQPCETASADATNVPSHSVDYIFTDPPFGSNLMYSELNFLWEAWLGVFTNNTTEAIENKTQGKGKQEYQSLMASCFREFSRILKPGRWMTVEFSNTQASIWNSIQTALQEAGFVVANVSALDKQQGSFKAVTTPTAVKQDLVISAYKPNGGLEERFAKRGETEEGVWDFVRTHLKNLPVSKPKSGQLEYVAERDPRILYDRMVAFYVGHSTPVPLSSAEFQAALAEKYPERDGMFFLSEQVNEYDKKRAQMENIGQLSIFVEDERSAINWLRNFLKDRPSTQQDIQPDFMQQLNASWKKWEARPELRTLLDQNYLQYNGTGEVPSQIHSYLSTQFKELRNLPKDHPQLRHKAKDRWYVPDPKNLIQVEAVRNKRLLEEFWSYLPEGYTPPSSMADRGQTLPGLTTPRPKIPKSRKLREVRTEAVRVGFKHCYQQKDYQTILAVAEMLPESILNEDEQLQMIYDNAAMRSGVET